MDNLSGMMNKRSPKYNYHRIFFRRILLTDSNIRLLMSLLLSMSVLLPITFWGIHKYGALGTTRFSERDGRAFLSRVVKLNKRDQPTTTARPSSSYSRLYLNVNKLLQGRTEPRQAAAQPSPRKERSRRQSVATAGGRSVDAKQQRTVSAVASAAEMRDAIDNIHSRIPPARSERRDNAAALMVRRNAYEENIKSISEPRRRDGAINLPAAGFTDFEMVTGYRDPEQTISVANTNKKYVKVCLERLRRSDPNARGNLTVRFVIDQAGEVLDGSVKIIASDIRDPLVLQCIVRNIRRWRNFPRVAESMGHYPITQKYLF